MDEKGPIRILLVHPVAVVRNGIAELLSTHPDLMVVGGAPGMCSALRLSRQTPPDVVVLCNPKLNATTLRHLGTLRLRWHCSHVLIGGQLDEEMIVRCAQAGVLSFMHREDSAEDVIMAIRAAHEGCLMLSRDVAGMIARHMHSPVAGSSRGAVRKRH